MNILYTMFDATVALGRIAGIVAMLLVFLFFFSILVLEVLFIAGMGFGAATFFMWLENPPDFFSEILES